MISAFKSTSGSNRPQMEATYNGRHSKPLQQTSFVRNHKYASMSVVSCQKINFFNYFGQPRSNNKQESKNKSLAGLKGATVGGQWLQVLSRV